MQQEYIKELKQKIDAVFRAHPNIFDHRQKFPWLTGFLGNPFAGIWFVAENPSLTMVERGTKQSLEPPTEETQWRVSRGDLLFRDMLVKYCFKEPPRDAAGGWNCYITDVIKETDYVAQWRTQGKRTLNQIAEIWSDVLIWELENSKPKLVVAMGKQTQRLLAHLQSTKGLRFAHLEYIHHYSYIALRPRGKQGPMHPERIKEYDAQIAHVAEKFARLRGQ